MTGPSQGGEEGMTLIEVMVGLLILTIGIMASVQAFIPAQAFTRTSDYLTVESSIAQQELERIEALGYSGAWLSDTPQASSDPNNPGYYVRATTPLGFQWDTLSSSAVEPLCTSAAGCNGIGSGLLSMSAWSVPTTSGTKSGKVYRYVTTVDDSCGTTPQYCTSTVDYKRVTVMVTHDGPGSPKKPYLISTLLGDPNAYRTG
jgi:prepilin-type N-terminal cleavage/methylation domain-containing protein